MLNWNWSYTLSTSVVTLAIISSLATHGAQAQTAIQTSNVVPASSTNALPNTLKVGETRSQSLSKTKDEAIARIHTHKVDGKNAATVYVRGIPVVTYIESEETAKLTSENAQADISKDAKSKSNPKGETKKNSESVKLPSLNLKSSSASNSADSPAKSTTDSSDNLLTSANPIERATAAAALINQLNRDGLDANQIIPAWKNGNYVIKLGDRATIKFDQQAFFPESLQNNTQDVLESANLLRRLFGGAHPVTEIVDAPKPQVATNSHVLTNSIIGVMSGMASWYGPGFDGNLSASGEIFNANELTAAHPELPFGTLVRVVNMDNNQSVVVRINDRGPYAEGRVIDMSAAAASVIGLVASGVAPVRLEILSR